jgi:hypothetical protein
MLDGAIVDTANKITAAIATAALPRYCFASFHFENRIPNLLISSLLPARRIARLGPLSSLKEHLPRKRRTAASEFTDKSEPYSKIKHLQIKIIYVKSAARLGNSSPAFPRPLRQSSASDNPG